VTDKATAHQRLIVDQFTKQAVPFSQMPDQSPEPILAAVGVGPTDTVLDVACGPGVLACAFAQVARHVTGIDLTPAMIDRAKAFQHSHSLANLTWKLGHVLPLPFPAASFSLVFTRYSFHHLLDPEAVLAEMVRVCSPGGRVAVVDVFTSSLEQAEAFNRMERLRDPSHVRALSLEELSGLLGEAGLQSVRRQFYKHEFGLEPVLKGSFPNPGDAERIRHMFEDDLAWTAWALGSTAGMGTFTSPTPSSSSSATSHPGRSALGEGEWRTRTDRPPMRWSLARTARSPPCEGRRVWSACPVAVLCQASAQKRRWYVRSVKNWPAAYGW
jgi:ubiquinone/menaquinone biosynthesis C-methylase UbiE